MAKDNNEIKVTFKAFNQDFNKAMTDMNKESAKLRQEMKLQSEQMKNSASESDKLKATMQGLEQRYEIQREKTAATAEALAKVKAQWGENSNEAQKYEKQLVSSQIAEQQIANEIIRTTESLEKAKAAEVERANATSESAVKLNELKATESELVQSSEKLNAQYELQKAQLGDNATESQKLSAQMDHLNSSHEVAGEKVKNYEQQLEQAKQQYGDNSSEAQKYEQQLLEARTAEQQLANQITDTNKVLNEQNDVLARTSERLQETGDKIANVGKNVTKKVSAPIALAGGAMIKFATDQENAFAQTSTLLDGSEKDLKAYKDSIRDLSSAMGVSFEEVAESVYGALSAGQTQADAVAFTEQAMKLAGGGFTDTATAVDVLTTALNAYKLESDEVVNVSDMLVTTQDLGKTTVDELGQSMGKVIPIAEGQNVAFDQLSTSYAVLTKNGQETSEAGTNLKAMLGELGKAGSKTDKILREQTGQAFSELMEDGSSLTDVLKIIKDDAEGSNLKLSDMFGSVQAGTAALTLAAEDGKEFDDFLLKMGDSAGATERNFSIMTATLQDKMNIAKTSVINAMAEMGEIVLPVIIVIADAVAKLATAFGNIPAPIQIVVLALGTILTIAGPLIWFIGTLMSTWGVLTGALINFPMIAALVTKAMTAIKLAIAGINLPVTLLVAAVAGAAYLIVKNWDWIKEKTLAVFGAIGDFLSEWGLTLLIILSGPIGWVVAYVIENWELVKEQTMVIFNAVLDFLSEWGLFLLAVLAGPIGLIVYFVVNNWEEIKAKTSEIFTGIGKFLEEIWNKIGAFFSTILKLIVSVILNWWDNLSEETRAKFVWVAEMIVKIWTTISTFFSNIVSYIVTTVREKFGKMSDTINEKMHDAWQYIVDVWNKILDFFMGITLFQEGRKLIGSFIDGMFSMFGKIGEAVNKLLSAIPDTVKNVLGIGGSSGYSHAIGAGIGEDMANGIKSKEKKVSKVTRDTVKKSGKAAIEESKKSAKELKKQKKKDDADAKKQATAAAKAERDAVTKALNDINSQISGKRAAGTSSASSEAAIWKDSIGNFKQGSKERIKAENEYAKSRDKAEKERLAQQKKQAAERKKLQASSVKSERDAVSSSMTKVNAEIAKRRANGGLSAKEEAAIWKANISQFKAGSKERIKAENSYAAALKKSQNQTTSQQKKTEKEKIAAQKKADRDALAAKKKKESDAKKQAQAAAKAERDAQVNAMQKVNAEIAEKRANGGLSAAEEAAIWKKAINQFKEGSKERIKAQNEYAAALKKADKELEEASKNRFDAIKQNAEDLKSLDQLSLKDEAEYWKKAIGQFKKGTKERISAQKEYQRTLKQINDNVVSVNKKYADQMKAINDKLVADVKDANDKYDNEFKSRRESYMNFAGLFDEFEVNMDKTGEDLLNNLNNQVDGFKQWQKEMEKLEYKGVDDSLIEELRQMGPKALPELLALNELTGSELNKYSNLFKEKAELATKQATDELAGMKDATKDSVQAMTDTANKELAGLESAWVAELKKVTSAAEDELQGMQQIGRDAGNSLLAGLVEMESALVSQAAQIARNVNDALRDTLGLVDVNGALATANSQIKGLSSTRRSLAVPESNAAIMSRMQSQAPAVYQGDTITNQYDVVATIREEADIKKVSQELYVLQQRGQRGRGR